jgi:hypothetical protein
MKISGFEKVVMQQQQQQYSTNKDGMKRIREMLEERKNLSSRLKDKSPSHRKSAQKNGGGY